MSDLFIMGNGFDRAHGMETSYYDFHQFIKDNCKNMPYIGVVELVSQDSENKIDGMIVYEPVEYLEFFQIIIDQTDGPDWKNFEDALGRLDFSDILRDYGTTYDTDSIKYLNGRSIESINQAVLTVKEMFPLWVKSILIDSRIKKKDRIQEMLNLGYFDLYSKGGKLRRLYIPKKLREETQKWLSEEQRTSGYLFLNRFTGTNVVKIASIVYAQSVKLSLCISIPT